MKQWVILLVLAAVWFWPGEFVLASPVTPGSFSTIWQSDNSGSTPSDQISFYLSTGGDGESCSGTIYWEEVGNDTNNGSSTIDFFCNQEIITFPTPGTYRVDILGMHPSFRFSFDFINDREKMISIEQWGDNQWESMRAMFDGAVNVEGNASDVPDLRNVTNMSRMFAGADKFNQNINNWDVSNVTNLDGIFSGALIFNQPLDNWDVSHVTNLDNVFYFADAFNQPLNSWNVQNVTKADYMFYFATNFNQSLNNWNIANIATMKNMFSGSALSESKYTALLTTWSALAVQPGISISADAQYCGTAQAARDILTTTYSWVISDGGSTDVCVVEEVEESESSSGGSSSTRVGYRLKDRLSSTTTSSTAAVGNEKSFFDSVRTLVDHITKNEDKLDKLTPEESTKLIVMLREIIIYLLTLLPVNK